MLRNEVLTREVPPSTKNNQRFSAKGVEIGEEVLRPTDCGGRESRIPSPPTDGMVLRTYAPHGVSACSEPCSCIKPSRLL